MFRNSVTYKSIFRQQVTENRVDTWQFLIAQGNRAYGVVISYMDGTGSMKLTASLQAQI